MDDRSKGSIVSDPEPIGDIVHTRTPEEDATPTSGSSMTVEQARTIADEVMDDTNPNAPMGSRALEAAVILKNKDVEKYSELNIHLKESAADTNLWKSAVKDKERELRKKKSRKAAGDRPIIIDRADLHLMVDESCEALKRLGDVYERGGEMVEITEDRDGPKIQPIQKGRVRDLLSRAARFETISKDDEARPIKPPSTVVDSVHARGTWDLPSLHGFVDGACMLANGDILSTSGYHPDAGLYVRHGVEVSGLRAPTKDDARAAYQHLTGLLVDFELVEENRAAHEAAWVACLLTILARPAIEHGPTPLFLFDANRPRTGKTRLADMACLIASGRMPDHESAPSGRGSDVEMNKIITSNVRAGVPIIFFDNVSGRFGGSSLENAITSRRWSGRILGKSEQFNGRLDVTWIATSNNSQLTDDMEDRSILIRIETTLENPSSRTGFKYPKIMRHVREHRPAYLNSALTILRAWYVAGQPEFDFLPLGSFEEWGEIIRNAVIFAGGPDPCDSRDQISDTNSTMVRLASVLEAWPVGRAFKSSEIAYAMKEGRFKGEISEEHTELADALNELLPSSNPQSVGTLLGYHKKKVIGGRWLVQGTGRARRSWIVEEV